MKSIHKKKNNNNKKQRHSGDATRFSHVLDLREVLLRKSQRHLWNSDSERKKNDDTSDTVKAEERT